MKYAVLWIALPVWLTAGLLVAEDVATPPAEKKSLEESLKPLLQREAYGAYVGEQKLGYSVDEMKIGEYEGRKVVISTSEEHIALSRGEAVMEIAEKAMSIYSLEDGTLLRRERKSVEDKKETRELGVREGDQFQISITIDGRETKRTVAPPKSTLWEDVERQTWATGPLNPGDSFTMHTLSLGDAQIEEARTMTFQKAGQLEIDGKPTDVRYFRVKGEDGNFLDAIATLDGNVQRVTIGFIQMRRESEEIARTLGKRATISLQRVPVDKPLTNPRQVQLLVVELTGLDPDTIDVSHRQRILDRGESSFVLEIKPDYTSDLLQEPLSQADLEKYTAATPTLQCDAEQIKELAMQIVGEETDPLKKMDKLQMWVFSNLAKTYNANNTTSLRVLESKAGDCTEHALLLVALARAVGLPAKQVMGLAYGEQEGQNGFWGHAWSEIHDGSRWVTVDPMWNQTLVDATHLTLTNMAGDQAAIKVKEVQLSANRGDAEQTHLHAIGNLSVSQLLSARNSLKMMYLALGLQEPPKDQILEETGALGRTLDSNIQALNKLERLSPDDRQVVNKLAELFQELKKQAENLSKHIEKATDESAQAFEKTQQEIDQKIKDTFGR